MRMLSADMAALPVPTHPRLRPTAFGLFKGTRVITASLAVKLVSDQDFSHRQTFHIINCVPPPAEVL
ncbi:hypothetical protein QBC42DRAFT_288245 [Cladorrhinum samala]|uniref:Uncharacterized protein n=1 Tax=Cladorrhinum samala TaxID=585594 RepID=A0AAV9HIW4_9PEZI|nr:hypothetical protein QBC42DRAFT_288245 [Cladorrhinum samala]